MDYKNGQKLGSFLWPLVRSKKRQCWAGHQLASYYCRTTHTVINKGDWGVHQDRDKEVIWRLLAAWHRNFWCKETAAAQWLLLFLVPLQPSTFQLQPATTTTTPHQAARRRKERTIISKSTIRLQQIRPWSWSLVFMCKWNTEIKQ